MTALTGKHFSPVGGVVWLQMSSTTDRDTTTTVVGSLEEVRGMVEAKPGLRIVLVRESSFPFDVSSLSSALALAANPIPTVILPYADERDLAGEAKKGEDWDILRSQTRVYYLDGMEEDGGVRGGCKGSARSRWRVEEEKKRPGFVFPGSVFDLAASIQWPHPSSSPLPSSSPGGEGEEGEGEGGGGGGGGERRRKGGGKPYEDASLINIPFFPMAMGISVLPPQPTARSSTKTSTSMPAGWAYCVDHKEGVDGVVEGMRVLEGAGDGWGVDVFAAPEFDYDADAHAHAASLMDLPDELLVEILCLLENKEDVVSVARSCQRLWRVGMDRMVWRSVSASTDAQLLGILGALPSSTRAHVETLVLLPCGQRAASGAPSPCQVSVTGVVGALRGLPRLSRFVARDAMCGHLVHMLRLFPFAANLCSVDVFGNGPLSFRWLKRMWRALGVEGTGGYALDLFGALSPGDFVYLSEREEGLVYVHETQTSAPGSGRRRKWVEGFSVALDRPVRVEITSSAVVRAVPEEVSAERVTLLGVSYAISGDSSWLHVEEGECGGGVFNVM